MNQESIIPDPDKSNPTNAVKGGAEPEIDKDMSQSPKEEDSENQNAHSAVSGADDTPSRGEAEKSGDKENPESDKESHGIENGDEDHQNPYPDEYDPTIKK